MFLSKWSFSDTIVTIGAVVFSASTKVKLIAYEPGEYLLTREKIGTRYVQVAVRTLVDPGNAEDVKAANALQDKIVARLVRDGVPAEASIRPNSGLT
jgi:hypothetical protein